MCKALRRNTASSAPSCFRPSTRALSSRCRKFPSVCWRLNFPTPRQPQPAAGSALPTGGITVRTYNVGVGFTNYELDLFGRIRSLSHAALQQYFSSGETRRSVQLTLVAEVATAYLTVLADQTLLDITRDTLKSQEESYALTQKMFSGGTTTELALRQAETTVDTARANLAQYNRQLAQDRDALQLLLGAPIPDGIDFSGGLDRGKHGSRARGGHSVRRAGAPARCTRRRASAHGRQRRDRRGACGVPARHLAHRQFRHRKHAALGPVQGRFARLDFLPADQSSRSSRAVPTSPTSRRPSSLAIPRSRSTRRRFRPPSARSPMRWSPAARSMSSSRLSKLW